jgi:MFS family permease
MAGSGGVSGLHHHHQLSQGGGGGGVLLRPPLPAWLIVLLLSVIPLLSLSHFFSYHAPSALGSSLKKYFDVDEADLAWLFTVYSAPNILAVLVGGLLMDRLGLVRTSLGFNLCVLLGMVVFACAPAHGAQRSMRYLLAGRFLLGIGGECIAIASQAMLARWFKRSAWLTFAMGWHTAMVQLFGSAPAFVLLPLALGGSATSKPSEAADDGGNVRLCLWIIVSVCGLSLLSNVAYALVELRYGAIFVASEVEHEFELEMGLDILRLEQRQKQQRSGRGRSGGGEGGKAAKSSKGRPLPRAPANAPNPSAKQGGAYAIVQSDHIEEVEVEPASPSSADAAATSALSTHDHALELEDEEDEETKQQQQRGARHDDDDGEDDHNGGSGVRALSDQPQSPESSSGTHGDGGGGSGAGGAGAERAGLLSGLSNLWRHREQSGAFGSDGSPLLSLSKPWQAMRSLPPLFWLCLTMHILLSPILYTFSAFGPSYFAEKLALSAEESAALTSLLYVAFVVAPFFGALIDRLGFRAMVQCAAATCIPCLFLALHFSVKVSPYVLMSLLGVVFAVTESNGLAMIADVSPSGLLGTAYGLVGVGTSFCMLFEPYVVGMLHVHTKGFGAASWLFVGVSFAGAVASFAVYVYDVNHDNLMTLSARRAAEIADGTALAQSAGGELELAPAYPELDIVFDDDDEDEDGGDILGSDEDKLVRTEEDELRLDEFDLAGLP